MTVAIAEALTAVGPDATKEEIEDAVRNAVSLGGDTDTLASITGGIAEAFYDMSAILRAECRNRVSEDILNVVKLFDETIGRRVYNSDEYENLSVMLL